ncbi:MULTISPECIES: hypothetical protein [Pseudomonadota]|jgi:hypothetical protein|uniref:Uncharacterized protein n=1 Tax=Mesorhizobium hungaricum TaxID=1566387 RepID=A0A1C2DIC9_9HYPH|nr:MULTISPECIES: hypothetical protein [Pseudomonadota]MBN9234404.1 hypothetical protein [Mesorhizobium sp.]MDQ0332469.1 hypothetical protein [Mesorhizobium sp. YL-MeA3-2017]OCX14508.1 hypothetical protein QV13_18780 [Mesorhizobium hungaricum]GAS12848.1 hypothetical protein NGUA26_04449 [Salmonella enterica]
MSERSETLDELLGDQIVQLVMERDGWRPEDVRLLFERARQRSAATPLVLAPHVIAKTCRPRWLGG